MPPPREPPEGVLVLPPLRGGWGGRLEPPLGGAPGPLLGGLGGGGGLRRRGRPQKTG